MEIITRSLFMLKENAYTCLDLRKWAAGGGGGSSEILCLERPASMLPNDLHVWVYKELVPFVEYLLCDNALVI